MTDGDERLLRYLLEDAATAEQSIGVSWLTPDGWERYLIGIPRTVPDTALDATDAFVMLDATGDATIEALYLEAIVRVWVPDKPGETLWP